MNKSEYFELNTDELVKELTSAQQALAAAEESGWTATVEMLVDEIDFIETIIADRDAELQSWGYTPKRRNV